MNEQQVTKQNHVCCYDTVNRAVVESWCSLLQYFFGIPSRNSINPQRYFKERNFEQFKRSHLVYFTFFHQPVDKRSKSKKP